MSALRPIAGGTIEVGNGEDCVAIWGDDWSGKFGLVLTPIEARALAARLLQQAGYAETHETSTGRERGAR